MRFCHCERGKQLKVLLDEGCVLPTSLLSLARGNRDKTLAECELTGIESRGCFDWEASYIFGRRRPKEYVQRKQHQPSYTDTYVCLSFEEECDIYAGLAVTVKRVSDSKRFVLPCAHLKATEKPSNNAQLLDDYVIWFVNYR